MNREPIGIVADDLTGAADTGVAFLAAGCSVVVVWSDSPDNTLWWHEADVVSLTTGSRALPAEEAARAVGAAVASCRVAGVHLLYKKIDSLLRGHIAEEVRAALTAWGTDVMALVAPAFPATRRTTVGGCQWVDGALLPGSVPGRFASAGLTTRHADLAAVRDGQLPAVMARAQADGIAVLVCDAETDVDMRTVAAAGLDARRAPLWVGSGGLARALAARLDAPQAMAGATWSARSPGLFVVGSRSPIARAQAAAVVADGAMSIVLTASDLESGSVGARACVDDVEAGLRAGRDVVVTVADGQGTPSVDDASLMTRLGERLAPCADVTGTIVLTGGDTATGVLQAWGVSGLRLSGEFEPGVVLATTCGAEARPVVTKSGSFGDVSTLVRVLDRIHARRN